MSVFSCRLICLIVLGSAGFTANRASADDSGIETKRDKTYVHPASRMSLRIGPNWQTIYEPYRPRKTGTTSILGMEEKVGEERPDKQIPKNVVMVYFSPMGNQPFSAIVNASDKDDKLGEEYDILVTVYGKDKIERPIIVELGEYKVFKIVVNAGPDSDLQGAGVVYLFQVGSGENRWRIKVRGTFPITDKEQSMKTVENVVKAFKPWLEVVSPDTLKDTLPIPAKATDKKEPIKEVVLPTVKGTQKR